MAACVIKMPLSPCQSASLENCGFIHSFILDLDVDPGLLCFSSSHSERTTLVTGQLTLQRLNSFCFYGWFCVSVTGRDCYFPLQGSAELRKSTCPQGDAVLRGRRNSAHLFHMPDSSGRYCLGCWIPAGYRDNDDNCVGPVFSKLMS